MNWKGCRRIRKAFGRFGMIFEDSGGDAGQKDPGHGLARDGGGGRKVQAVREAGVGRRAVAAAVKQHEQVAPPRARRGTLRAR